MSRGSATLAVCLLVLLAGCSGLTGSGGDGVPGVEDGGLVDAGALAEAHADALTDSGYSHEIEVNQTRIVDGETAETNRAQRTSVAPGAAEYTYQLLNRGDVSSRFIVWGNESVEYRSVEAGGDRQFSRSEPASARALSGVHLLEAHLSAPYEVTETREIDDGTVTVLEATDRPDSGAAFPNEAEDVRSYTARLVVDADGRILAFDAAAEYDIDGETAEYDMSFEVTELGDPDVQRPGWVDQLED